jgi:hypothetical protein
MANLTLEKLKFDLSIFAKNHYVNKRSKNKKVEDAFLCLSPKVV